MRTIEEITAAMTALVDGAADRSLTDEEVTQYEGMEQELQAVKRDNDIRARNAAYNTVRVPAGTPRATPGPGETYGQAFNAYLRTGKPNADLIAMAQSEGTPSEGGYLVPDEFRTKMVEKLKAFGGIGGLASRYTTGTGAPVDWPTLDDTANVGEITQEGNTFSSGADVAFGTNSLTSYTYMAGGSGSTPLRINYELAQDTAFDLEGLITRLLSTRIARIQATHFATGTGVQQPLGLVTGRTPVQAAANTGFVFDDFVEWEHSLDPAYRGSARWLMNDTTLKIAKKIADSNGDPIFRGWGANMALGFNESTLLGYPLSIDQAMPDYSAADHTKLAIVFGDVNQGYVIRDVRSVQLLVNPYSRMSYRQIEYSAWMRCDATQQDTNAYIVGSGKS